VKLLVLSFQRPAKNDNDYQLREQQMIVSLQQFLILLDYRLGTFHQRFAVVIHELYTPSHVTNIISNASRARISHDQAKVSTFARMAFAIADFSTHMHAAGTLASAQHLRRPSRREGAWRRSRNYHQLQLQSVVQVDDGRVPTALHQCIIECGVLSDGATLLQ
jgi:hypothetical protein